MCTSSDAIKAKIRLARNCGTSQYSLKTMNELPDLPAIFLASKIYGENSIFLRMYRVGKNANHFPVSTDKFPNNISNHRQWDTHILFNELANRMEKTYNGPLFTWFLLTPPLQRFSGA